MADGPRLGEFSGGQTIGEVIIETEPDNGHLVRVEGTVNVDGSTDDVETNFTSGEPFIGETPITMSVTHPDHTRVVMIVQASLHEVPSPDEAVEDETVSVGGIRKVLLHAYVRVNGKTYPELGDDTSENVDEDLVLVVYDSDVPPLLDTPPRSPSPED